MSSNSNRMNTLSHKKTQPVWLFYVSGIGNVRRAMASRAISQQVEVHHFSKISSQMDNI